MAGGPEMSLDWALCRLAAYNTRVYVKTKPLFSDFEKRGFGG